MTPATPDTLRCPACGFRIFNRRYPMCESCKLPLPPELVYSREQILAMQTQEALEAKARANAKRKRDGANSGDGGDIDFGSIGSDSSCGDGGGGGCGGGD